MAGDEAERIALLSRLDDQAERQALGIAGTERRQHIVEHGAVVIVQRAPRRFEVLDVRVDQSVVVLRACRDDRVAPFDVGEGKEPVA